MASNPRKTATRRDLLKIGAAGAIGAGLASGTKPSVAEAAVGSGLAYQVHCFSLTNPATGARGPRISAFVSGPPGDLSGYGWDTGPNEDIVGGACFWTVVGTAFGKRLDLTGRVLLANDPTALAAIITMQADFDSGECTWSLQRLNAPPAVVNKGVGTVVRI